MPVAKEQIQQIISENNLSSVTDVYHRRAEPSVIRVDEPLQMNQKVIVIPIENEVDIGESAANPHFIEQEKDAWRKAALKKYAKE